MALSERKYLTGREYASLKTLFAVVSSFTACTGNLQARCEAAGIWDKLQEVGRLADECLGEILLTVPDNKLMHIRADIQNVKIYIKTEAPGQETHKGDYSYTPTATLNELLNYLCQNECSMCDKSAAESRKCPYKKMIWDALPHLVGGEDREHCKYSDMILGLEV